MRSAMWLFLACLVCIQPVFAAPPAAAVPADFAEIELDDPASGFTLSEDGRHLAITHLAAGKITIWDVAQGKAVASIEAELPRATLFRGDELFVAHATKGRIGVYSRAQKWKLVNELKVDAGNIIFLSAPSRQAFKGEILVTSHGDPKNNRRDQEEVIFAVKTKADECRSVLNAALATVSCDGKIVVTQDSFNYSPGGGIRAYAYKEFVAGGKPNSIYGGGGPKSSQPRLYQVHEGSYWFSNDTLWGGGPIAPIRSFDDKALLVPDLTRRAFYALTRTALTGYSLSSKPREMGQHELEKFDPGPFFTRRYDLQIPIACTLGDDLHLFLLQGKSNSVLHAKFKAFESAPATLEKPGAEPAKTKPLAPTRGAMNTAPGRGEPGAAPPVTEAEGDKGLGLPEFLVEGRPASIQLREEKGARFELAQGPNGLTLTNSGALRWTPTSASLGRHELKIKITAGDNTRFERPVVEVIAKETLAPDGKPFALANSPRLELEPGQFSLTPGLGHRSLLLLQGDRLRILKPDGITVAQDRALPARFTRIAERETTYVAISDNPKALCVLDKSTLAVKQTVKLSFLEVTDLALDPRRPISYVAGRTSNDLPGFKIAIVAENTGELKEPEGLIGTWVAVSPDGRSLYAGYRDLYQRGHSYHINPDWNLIVIPEFGNIDSLIEYDLAEKISVKRVVKQAGGNGSGLRLSPDGARISYLSFTGFPRFSGSIPAWSTADITQPPLSYALKPLNAPATEMVFHPTLKLVAVPAGASVIVLHRETGVAEPQRIALLASGLGEGVKIDSPIFAPDGRGLIIHCFDAEGNSLLCKIGLRLSAQEIETATKGVRTPTRPNPEAVPPDGSRIKA